MSETKACPYCGETILVVAVKCKHCGSTIAGPAAAIKNQFRMRPVFAVLGTLVAALFVAGFVYNWNRTGTVSGAGFSEADVANIQNSIRNELAKRAKVEDVQMIRESPTRLSGFAKVKVPLLGTVTKRCTANYGEGGQSIWECK